MRRGLLATIEFPSNPSGRGGQEQDVACERMVYIAADYVMLLLMQWHSSLGRSELRQPYRRAATDALSYRLPFDGADTHYPTSTSSYCASQPRVSGETSKWSGEHKLDVDDLESASRHAPEIGKKLLGLFGGGDMKTATAKAITNALITVMELGNGVTGYFIVRDTTIHKTSRHIALQKPRPKNWIHSGWISSLQHLKCI